MLKNSADDNSCMVVKEENSEFSVCSIGMAAYVVEYMNN